VARMYPRTLIDEEVKSGGEKRVFAALRDGLSNEWEAYHSASWMMRDPGEGALDGEIDFVLCHPEEAILCLEVKGGGIQCQYGEWTRVIDGNRKRVKDPFTQALDHRYALERQLDRQDGIRAKDFFLVQGLAFPDITVHELVLAPDAPPEIVIDRNDLKEIDESVERVLDYHRGAREKRKPPGEKGAAALRELLAPEVRIEVPMSSEFLDEEEALITLTHDQAMLLNRFGRDPRMVVTGCAGSGKTMLAVEQAKRLARKGRDVLLVCFNRALRDHLRSREAKSGVEFQTFHGLCVQLAHRAGVELPQHPEDETPPEFWDEELPNALVKAIEKLGPQYDALFVDEAQDLENHWLDALMLTLRDPDEDLVWLFMDANQRVYEARLDIPKEFRPFDLTVNCRNTQAIAREVLKKYVGEVEPEVIGPPGREVELIQTDNQAAAVGAIIQRLCGKEEVPPQDVVVLSSHNLDESKVGQVGLPAPYTFVKEPVPLGPKIRFSSIRGFKGLESPVVILCELEDIDDATIDQQLYVGISRARNHCVVIAPPAPNPSS
jgi:AAA domain/Nuclease-related domain/UvrD-like helicase C-terminal domain